MIRLYIEAIDSRDNIIGSAALLDLPLWHESILALAEHSSTHYHENSTQIDGNPLLNWTEANESIDL